MNKQKMNKQKKIIYSPGLILIGILFFMELFNFLYVIILSYIK